MAKLKWEAVLRNNRLVIDFDQKGVDIVESITSKHVTKLRKIKIEIETLKGE